MAFLLAEVEGISDYPFLLQPPPTLSPKGHVTHPDQNSRQCQLQQDERDQEAPLSRLHYSGGTRDPLKDGQAQTSRF